VSRPAPIQVVRGVRATLWVVVAIALVSCGSPPGSPSPTSSPDPSAVGLNAFEQIGCHTLHLKEPDGDDLDLSGTWTSSTWLGATSDWAIRQLGNCVFRVWLGGEGTASGDDWISRISCEGELRTDFTGDGRCVTVGRDPTGQPLQYWPERFEVTFSESAEAELHVVEGPCLQTPIPAEMIEVCAAVAPWTRVRGAT